MNGSLSGLFLNLIDVPYIDYDAQWWFADQMKSISFNEDYIHVLMGDLLLSNYANMTSMFYNKEMYESIYGDKESLYDIVNNNKWTYDKYFALVEGAYSDINGDGISNPGDRFGAHYETGSRTGSYYPYTSGVAFTTRDENGYPVLNFNTEKSHQFVDKLYAFVYENKGSFEMTYDEAEAAFFNKQMLFYTYFLSRGTALNAQTEFDYGVVPFPKLDETVDYTSAILTGAGVIVVPFILPENRLEITCATLEALCSESYRSVVPNYYENVLKKRQVSSEEDGQMIDKIRSSLKFDVTFWMSSSIGGVGNVFRNVVITNKGKDFASYWDSNVSKYQTALDGLVKAFNEGVID